MEQSSSYVTDAENMAEMARLIKQARQVTQCMGLLPQEIPEPTSVLDLGCGPGSGL
ncbi:hypothetical protein [Ktedonosporobacter rubrisoli]|uniref:hypothetical protein n=1 Tax=Ktedonosporobacter rubrisoli TaxID=2509675 RepID=UPI0013EEB8A8|nr:hypothetical protein [Ktedonosporobacter rubrisoli]